MIKSMIYHDIDKISWNEKIIGSNSGHKNQVIMICAHVEITPNVLNTQHYSHDFIAKSQRKTNILSNANTDI